MCSTWSLVVQSTMVFGRSVRGSAAKATMTSLVRMRSWPWAAGTITPSAMASTAASFSDRIMNPPPFTVVRAEASRPCALDAELRVEDVAEPVAYEVDAERGERERGPRKGGEPPRDVEEVTALGEHAAPRRRRGLDAEAEEGNGRLGDDELRELQARHDDDGWHHVGKHVAEQRSRASHPQCGRRLHVVPLLHRQHLPSDHASIHDPAGGRQTDDDVAEPEADDGVDGQREEDEGKRELHVGDAHEDGPRPAPEEAGEESEETARDRGDEHGAHADEQRDPRAVEHARAEVAAELIGAERMAGRARR